MCFGYERDSVFDVKVDRRVSGVLRGSGLVVLFAVELQSICKELCRDVHLVNGAEQLAAASREIEFFRQHCDIVSTDVDFDDISSTYLSPVISVK